MQDVRSLMHQAYTEDWEELNLSRMNLTELPLEIAWLTGVRSLILGGCGRMEGGRVIDYYCER